MKLSSFYRKKTYDDSSVIQSNLKRVLGIFDVTCMATSFTIAGVYILLSDVVSHNAGPATIVSFVVAGFSTCLAALCYAELGARVPRAGSAYTYIYVTIGEFVAFVMGWDLILEYVIGTASIASSLSQNIDFFFNNQIHASLNKNLPIQVTGIAASPDFLAFAVCLLATFLMLLAVKESALLTKILTVINIIFLVFAIICGATKADPVNWHILKLTSSANISVVNISTNLPCTDSNRIGEGGFAPFGLNGILTAGAKCFYAYIGFDAICASGEEVKNPQKTIPIGIMLTLAIVSIHYFSMSIVYTLMIPYCAIDQNAPLAFAFDYVGLTWAKYVVATGALISLVACLYASMFPMPRIVYTMSIDGLLFKPFEKLVPGFKTPLTATIVTGCLAAILALIIDLNQLIDMMSIGTLLAYSIVTICVLVLRYRPFKRKKSDQTYFNYIFVESKDYKSIVRKLFKPKIADKCDLKTSQYVSYLTVISVLLIITICLIMNLTQNLIENFLAIGFIIFIGLLLILISILIWLQPQNNQIKTFKAPLLPFLPLLTVFLNVYLMINLPVGTWYRFLAWFLIGLIVYLVYGIHNSKENLRNTSSNDERAKCCISSVSMICRREESKAPKYYSSKQDDDKMANDIVLF